MSSTVIQSRFGRGSSAKATEQTNKNQARITRIPLHYCKGNSLRKREMAEREADCCKSHPTLRPTAAYILWRGLPAAVSRTFVISVGGWKPPPQFSRTVRGFATVWKPLRYDFRLTS